jgi:hypothetical protein
VTVGIWCWVAGHVTWPAMSLCYGPDAPLLYRNTPSKCDPYFWGMRTPLPHGGKTITAACRQRFWLRAFNSINPTSKYTLLYIYLRVRCLGLLVTIETCGQLTLPQLEYLSCRVHTRCQIRRLLSVLCLRQLRPSYVKNKNM